MKSETKMKRDLQMPTFVVRMWDVSEGKVKARGHDTSEWKKRYRKHYWEGRIEHVQTGKAFIFHDVAELLRFIQDRRL